MTEQFLINAFTRLEARIQGLEDAHNALAAQCIALTGQGNDLVRLTDSIISVMERVQNRSVVIDALDAAPQEPPNA